jgi:dTDP-4-dehydrorhamnose 3,5-epimerase-like enzyme
MATKGRTKFPEIKKDDRGKFTRWAKNNDFKDACSAATAVLDNKDAKGKNKSYSSAVKKMANYANNFGCKGK